MKTIFTILFAVLTSVPALAQQKPGDFGIGVILGSPSAITSKYFFTRETAFDMGLAFSYYDSMLFYSDYLIHYPGRLGRDTQFLSQLTPYFGVGGILVITNQDRRDDDRYLGKKSGSVGLGLRIPLGIEWVPHVQGIGIFLEFTPGLSIIPTTTGTIEGGLGVRYYFH